MGFITGEAVYPGHYTTYANTVSDLSGTEPPHSIMVQPSRTIFIVTMLVAGVMLLAGDAFLARVTDRRRLVVTTGLLGLGCLGVGVFPGNVATWHPLFATMAFVGGSLAALMSRKVIDGALRHFATAFGVTALLATVFASESMKHWGPQDALGRGGIERWIVYPVLFWLVAFGAYLMARAPRSGDRSRRTRRLHSTERGVAER